MSYFAFSSFARSNNDNNNDAHIIISFIYIANIPTANIPYKNGIIRPNISMNFLPTSTFSSLSSAYSSRIESCSVISRDIYFCFFLMHLCDHPFVNFYLSLLIGNAATHSFLLDT
eukprot:1944_1